MIISIIAFYLKVKQNHTIQLVSRSKSSYSRMIHWNRRYTNIMDEINQYNGLIGRVLDCLLLIFTIVLCYIIYLLLFTNMIPKMKFVFSSVLLAHVISLAFLTGGSASVSDGNLRMAKEMHRLYHQNRNSPSFRFQLKAQLLSENYHLIKSGFRLRNGYFIDNTSFFSVSVSRTLRCFF